MDELFDVIFDAIYNFFVPDCKLTTNIGRLLASGHIDQCATYIKALNKKKLKREFKYIIAHAKKPGDTYAMHRYKLMNELYELIFKEKSRYYDEKFYQQCVENEPENERDIDFYVKKLQPSFND